MLTTQLTTEYEYFNDDHQDEQDPKQPLSIVLELHEGGHEERYEAHACCDCQLY